MNPVNSRLLLRHTVATLAYRGGKVLRDAAPTFADFPLGDRTRTPVQILAHIGDLLEWALWLAKGQHVWHDSTPLAWDAEVERFYSRLALLDTYLASDEPLGFPEDRLFQGPIADALSHVGQIAMLRRIAGSPVRGENYFKADIQVGRVGAEQSTKKLEFE